MWNSYDSNGLPIQSLPLGYALMSITYITTTGVGSYTTPAGCRAIIVRAIGGGGAGGGASTAASYCAGGGGGGGAYAEKRILSPVASYSVSVGAGGTAGTAGNNPGNVGGDTTFATTTVVAKGGLGGAADTGTVVGHIGGIGGDVSPSANTGDLSFMGQTGGAGVIAAASQALGGYGGQAAHGFGPGGIGKKNTGADGTVGGVYGGGGAGAAFIVSGTNRAGGAGGAGILVIEEYA